jgi:hypothetical protein
MGAAHNGKGNGQYMGRIASADPGIHGGPAGRMARARIDAGDHQGLHEVCLLRGGKFSLKKKKQDLDETAMLHEFEEVVAVATAAFREVGICCCLLFLPDAGYGAAGKLSLALLNLGVLGGHFGFASMTTGKVNGGDCMGWRHNSRLWFVAGDDAPFAKAG